MVTDEEIRTAMVGRITEIKKEINNDVEIPKEFKVIFNHLTDAFDKSYEHYDQYSALSYFLYLIIKMVDIGPECVIANISVLTKALVDNYSDAEDGEINLFDEKGKRISLKDLGIDENNT